MTRLNLPHHQIMRGFYSEIEAYIRKQPEIQKIIAEHVHLFEYIDDEKAKFSMLVDWVIFDFRKEPNGSSVLVEYLMQADLTSEKVKYYSAFNNNIFSLFEVKALRIGKELLIYDLLGKQEYSVKDARASTALVRNQCFLTRVLPFENYYILTGQGFPLPKSETPLLKLSQRVIQAEPGTRLNSLDVIKMFSQLAKSKEKGDPEQELIELCVRAGIKREEVLRILQTTHQDFLGTGHASRTVVEIVEKLALPPDSQEIIKQIQDAVMVLWNSWVRASNKNTPEKGPLEKNLISIGLNYVMREIGSQKLPPKQGEIEANRLLKRWLSEPQLELDEKTPLEVILQEREQLGNTEKNVKFDITIAEVKPGVEIEAKAEKLFYLGADQINNHAYEEAAVTFLEYLELAPWNHVVWHNLAVAYLCLEDFSRAIPCLEKALELKPDYSMAKEKLERAKRIFSQEDLKKSKRSSGKHYLN